MTDLNGENPTVIGADAKFKGELAFDKGVRIEGSFDGQIRSKGMLHVAEGAVITANVEATNVKIEGECKGNLLVSEKLHLLATAKMEGDIRTNRLEIADGAIFVGNVVVGQSSGDAAASRPGSVPQAAPQPQMGSGPGQVNAQAKPQAGQQRRPQDMRVPAGS